MTKILGEKVKKSNFRAALKRYWKTNVDREESLAIQDSELNLDTVGVNFGDFDDLYVRRTAIESVCCQTLSQPGALLRLKGSRLIGKTSLINQVLVEMKDNDYAVVNLSLKLTDKNTHFTSLNRFLRWFCSNVSRETENFTLEDGANISATTTSGLGGNITIDTEFLIGSGNSDIVANAFDGMGGFIQITATGILGLETRNQLTDSSDITAFSQQNPQLNGTVEINTLEIDQNFSLLELPSNPVSAQVVQACERGDSEQESKFIISGRGGLPDSPQGNLSSDFGLEDWRAIEGQDSSTSVSDERLYETSHDQTKQIVEANKLVFDSDGTAMLVADNSADKLNNLTQQLPTNCLTN